MTGIEIARRLEDDQLLTREQIINIVEDIESHLDLAKAKIPKIMSEIDQQDINENKRIPGNEVQVIVDKYSKEVEPESSTTDKTTEKEEEKNPDTSDEEKTDTNTGDSTEETDTNTEDSPKTDTTNTEVSTENTDTKVEESTEK